MMIVAGWFTLAVLVGGGIIWWGFRELAHGVRDI